MDELRRFDRTNNCFLNTLAVADGSCTPEQMGALLTRNRDKLVMLSTWYKPRSKEAAAQIRSGTVEKRQVNKPLQDFIIHASELLDLNEIQTLQLISGYIWAEVKGSQLKTDDDAMNLLVDYYCNERISLFSTMCCLLRYYRDPNHLYNAQSREFLKTIPDLPHRVTELYRLTKEAPVPSHMERQWREKWANHNVTEQYAILEIIFLLYYDYTVCEPPELFNYLQLLRDCGSKQVNEGFLNDYGRETVKKIGFISVLILIEVMHLECFVEENTSTDKMVNVEKLMENNMLTNIDNDIKNNWGNMLQHGPVLLAWASLLCQINNNSSNRMVFSSYASTALIDLKAIPYLSYLISEGVSLEDHNGIAYKSVIKGLISIVLTAFHVGSLPDYDSLVDLYANVFAGHPQLARQFWDTDCFNDPLMSLVESVTEIFPQKIVPLCKIMTALASDVDSSCNVFKYLCFLSTYQKLFSSNDVSHWEMDLTDVDHPHVRNWRVILDNKVTIPSNSVGIIVERSRLENEDWYVVRWRLNYSGWHVMLGVIGLFLERVVPSGVALSENDVSEVTAILGLVRAVISHDKELVEELLEHFANCSRSPVTTPNSVTNYDLVYTMFQIFQNCANQTPPPVKLLTACMECIHSFAKTNPRAVWAMLQRSRILEGPLRMNNKAPVPHVLNSVECVTGDYSITIAFLDLLTTLLSYVQQWHHLAERNGTIFYDFGSCLSYVRTNLWSSCETWRYTDVRQRWQISSKILNIFYEILSDTPTILRPSATAGKEMSVKESLLRSLLYDSSFHANLLKLIGIGPYALMQLLKCQQELLNLVMNAFTVLELVLVLKEDKGTMCSLEHALFSKKIGAAGQDLIEVIASYIHYYYVNSELSLTATRILILLCTTGANGQRPPSLVGYLEPSKEQLRATYLQKLQDRRFSNENLRITIIDLITATLEPQPGFAAMFLDLLLETIQEKGEETTGHPDDETYTENTIGKILSLSNVENLLIDQPRLIASVLNLLSSLWKNAPAHHMLLSALRKKDNFWRQLVKLIQSDPYEEVEDEEIELKLSNQSYRILSRAYAFQVLMYEVFHVPPNKLDDQLYEQLKLFFEDSDPDLTKKRQIEWAEHFTQIAFNPETYKAILQQCKLMAIDITDVLVVHPQKIFGKRYMYDTIILSKKLGIERSENISTPLDVARITQAHDFVSLVEYFNEQLSLTNAQLELVKSWRRFLEILLIRQSKMGLLQDKEVLLSMIGSLVQRLSKERSDFKVIMLINEEISLLLQVLVKQWASQPDGSNESVREFESEGVALDKMVSILNGLGQSFHVTLSTYDRDGGDGDRVLTNLITCLLILFKTVRRQSTDSGYPLLSLDRLHYQVQGREPRRTDDNPLYRPVWPQPVAQAALTILSDLFDTLKNPSLRQASLAILDVISRTLEDPSILTKYLSYRNLTILSDLVVGMLSFFKTVSRPSRSGPPQVRLGSEPSLTEVIAILHFMLSLSSTPVLAEQLVANGLMDVFSNDEWGHFVQMELLPYLETNEPNPFHSIWCLVLSIVTQLLWSLGHNEEFMDKVLHFVAVHRLRMETMLDQEKHRVRPLGPSSGITDMEIEEEIPIKNRHSTTRIQQPTSQEKPKSDDLLLNSQKGVTLRSLHETELITALLYCFVHFDKQEWDKFSKNVVQSYTVGILKMMIQTKKSIETLNVEITPVLPVSKEEKNLEKPVIGAPVSTTSTFQKDLTLKLYNILRNTLSFIRLRTPKTILHHEFDSDDTSTFRCFFEPDLETADTTNPYPPIGVLCHILRVPFHSTTSPLLLRNMLYIVENTFYLLLAHAYIYSTYLGKQTVSQDIVYNAGLFLSEFDREWLRVMRAMAATEEEEKEKEYLFRHVFEGQLQKLKDSIKKRIDWR